MRAPPLVWAALRHAGRHPAQSAHDGAHDGRARDGGAQEARAARDAADGRRRDGGARTRPCACVRACARVRARARARASSHVRVRVRARARAGKTALLGGVAQLHMRSGRPFFFTIYLANAVAIHPTDSSKVGPPPEAARNPRPRRSQAATPTPAAASPQPRRVARPSCSTAARARVYGARTGGGRAAEARGRHARAAELVRSPRRPRGLRGAHLPHRRPRVRPRGHTRTRRAHWSQGAAL